MKNRITRTATTTRTIVRNALMTDLTALSTIDDHLDGPTMTMVTAKPLPTRDTAMTNVGSVGITIATQNLLTNNKTNQRCTLPEDVTT